MIGDQRLDVIDADLAAAPQRDFGIESGQAVIVARILFLGRLHHRSQRLPEHRAFRQVEQRLALGIGVRDPGFRIDDEHRDRECGEQIAEIRRADSVHSRPAHAAARLHQGA